MGSRRKLVFLIRAGRGHFVMKRSGVERGLAGSVKS